MEQFLATDYDLVRQLSDLGTYQYIIVGSGIGGGILAEDLARRGKKVLLIEKGSLAFSTHICNTARPDFARGRDDSAEGNETVYNHLKSWVQVTDDSEPYSGGPLYCLGGRSVVWGLWIPRTDAETLNARYPERVSKALQNYWFDKAFALVTNGSQTSDNIYPQGRISSRDIAKAKEQLKLGIEGYIRKGHDLDLGPLATQFDSSKPYRFPQGAYSTVESLLNRLYRRDENLTVLLGAEVIQLQYAGESKRSVVSLTIRQLSTQRIFQISAKGASVILSAGTICTASIALNSGLQTLKLHDGQNFVGKGLIDHAVWAVRFAMKRPEGSKPGLKDPLLLQTMINICGTTALLTVTINNNFLLAGSSSLPIQQYLGESGEVLELFDARLDFREDKYDTVAILLEFGAPLKDDNKVLNTASPSPVIRMRRLDTYSDEPSQIEMQILATRIRNALTCGVLSTKKPLYDFDVPLLSKVLSKTALSSFEPLVTSAQAAAPADKLSTFPNNFPERDLFGLLKALAEVLAPRPALLPSGIFAHEVGTMRMDSSDGTLGVVNKNLRVHSFTNLRVCDLSVFPYSAPANPTLTLAALSLRLAKHLVLNEAAPDEDSDSENEDSEDEDEDIDLEHEDANKNKDLE